MHLLAILAVGAAMQSNPLADLKNSRDLHEYDLLDVKWDVDINFAAGSIKGRVVNQVKTQKDGAVLVFNCAALQVSQITLNGKATEILKSGDLVGAKCPSSIKAGTVVNVAITYTGKPEAGIYFVPANRAYPAKTDVVFTQGEMIDNRYWLPTYDEPNDKATSEGIIHVPKGWKVLSNGRLVEQKDTKDQSMWHWKMDQAHSTYLISLVAGKYSIVPDGKWQGIEVSNWVPTGLEDWMKTSFGGTDKIVAFYSKLTGTKYPWAKYSQSAVPDFMFGGMENVTCTTQTIGAIHPKTSEPNDDATGLVAHELAHQWFGDLITTPVWDSIWVNEGWATFLPHFWMREKYGDDAFNTERFGTYQGALGASTDSTRPMVWAGWQEPIDMFDGFAYPGGSTRMMMLMHMVGEEKFWKAVKAYLAEYQFKNVDTEGFFKTFSRELGIDLTQFKKQWFYTAGAPSLHVVKSSDGFSVTQSTTGFDVPVEYAIYGKSGSQKRGKFQIGTDKVISIPADEGDVLVLDPEAWLMTNIGYPDSYDSSVVVKMFMNAKNVAQKMRVMNLSGFGKLSQEQVSGLIRVEASWQVSRQLIGKSSDEGLITEFATNKDPRIAQEAINRIINLPKKPTFEPLLKGIFGSTKNDLLKWASFNALYSITRDSALIERAWTMDSPSQDFRVNALSWWEQTDKNRARVECLKAVKGNDIAPVRNRAIQILGRVKDKPGEKIVFKTLTGLMSERAYSPLSATVNALAEYGDKDALPILRTRENHSLHFLRRTIRVAIARLNNL